MRRHATWAAAATTLAAAACADEPVIDEARLLSADFTDEFWIGDDPAERQFARITSMAFAPNGHLVVVDSDNFAVVAFDEQGGELRQWGNRGEGPGEFENEPTRVAVSVEGTVAVRSFRRVDVFTLEGAPIGSHLLDTLVLGAVAFDGDGNALAEARRSASLPFGGGTEHLIRLRDGRVLWSFRPLPPSSGFVLFGPHSVTAGLGRNSVLAGMSDEYDMAVLDASTGRRQGRITRPITLRLTPEGFSEDLRQTYGGSENADILDQISMAEVLPVVAGAFMGPPGRTVWVRRGMGVDDSLAPPLGTGLDEWTLRLYDLFDGDSYEYAGTVEIPEDLELMTGDSERVAGVHEGPLGVHSVRVLRVEIKR